MHLSLTRYRGNRWIAGKRAGQVPLGSEVNPNSGVGV